MESLDVFYQAEGLLEVQHLEVAEDATVLDVKALIVTKHGHLLEALIFIEDEEEPLSDDAAIKAFAHNKAVKAHLHRCQHVLASVRFNGRTVERRFRPSATVARVKKWAAEREFGMSPEDAGEHVLQIAHTHDRPAPGTHIGTLTDGKTCAVAFHLVPDERVNG